MYHLEFQLVIKTHSTYLRPVATDKLTLLSIELQSQLKYTIYYYFTHYVQYIINMAKLFNY